MRKTAFVFSIIYLVLTPLFTAYARGDVKEGGGAGRQRDLPVAPLILHPEEIEEIRGITRIQIRWLGAPDAAGYHLVLARDRNFKYIIYENSGLAGTSQIIGDLNYGTLFLKISSISSGGVEGPFSDMLSFILVPPPPLSPIEGEKAPLIFELHKDDYVAP